MYCYNNLTLVKCNLSEVGEQMPKILKIKNDVVVIGLDDRSLREVRIDDCEFIPEVGMEVEIFGNETTVIVHKVEKIVEKNLEKGINIKIDNSNNVPLTTPLYVGGKVVNKTVYLLLAFFLGGFGIHKFYAGKIGTGIAFILFSWTFIPALIALIEFFVALFKTADSMGNIVV